MEAHLLSICIGLPLCSALVAVLWDDAVWVYRCALVGAVGAALIALSLVVGFETSEARWDWIPELGITYRVGLDGIALFPFALTALALVLALAVCRRTRGEIVGLSVVASAALGAYAAQDLLAFYFCAEAAILPLLVLMCREDGRPRAGLRLALGAAAGGVPLLVAVVYLGVVHLSQVGHLSFDLLDLQSLDLPAAAQAWLLLAFLFGLAVRVPLAPLHGWLQMVLRVASPAVLLVLTGAWLHLGAYGIMRFCPTLFPDAFSAWRGPLAALAAATAVYGALIGLAQGRMRAWLACATLSQMGWVVFGICTLHAAGLRGSAVVLVGHGLVIAAWLLLAGMLAERGIDAENGLGRGAPRLSAWLLVAALAAVGLPGTVLFAGEFSILVAACAAWGQPGLLIAVAALLHGVSGLRLIQRIVWGAKGATAPMDMRWREMALVVPLLLCALALGLKPGPVLDRVGGSIDQVLAVAAPAATAGEGE